MALGNKKVNEKKPKQELYHKPPGKPDDSNNVITGGNVTKRWFDLKKQYNHPWDPISELIQNSVIAIEDLNDNDFNQIPENRPHLEIRIDEQNKKFSVMDLGVGLPDSKYFSHQNTTRLKSLSEVGKSGMGLGLTATLSRSCKLRCITRNKTNGEVQFVEFSDFCKKIISEGAKELKGQKPDLSFGDQTLTKFNGELDNGEIPSGRFTIMEVEGKHEDGLNIMWDWITINGFSNFVQALLYHSVLGHIGSLLNKPHKRDIRWKIIATNKEGEEITLPPKGMKSLKEHHLSNPPDKHLFLNHNQPEISTAAHLLKYSFTGKNSTDPLNKNHLKLNILMICANRVGGREFLAESYGSFLTHNDGKYMDGGDDASESDSKSSLVFLSIKGFPQPIRINFERSANRTVDPFTLIIIDADKNVLDTGRRTILSQYQKQINTRLNDGLKKLNKKYEDDRKANKSGAGTTSQDKTGLGGKGKSKSHYGGQNITGISNKPKNTGKSIISMLEGSDDKDISKPVESFDSILIGEPLNEKATDALFINCVCEGILEGIKLSGVGDNNSDLDFQIKPEWRLTRIGKIHTKALVKKHGKKIEEDDVMLCEVSGKEVMTLESKWALSKLVVDLEDAKSVKKFHTIDFCICWDLKLTKPQTKKKYRVIEAAPSLKWHPQVTHILDKEDNPSESIQIINLKAFVNLDSDEEE